jgi:chorismate synthase
MMAEVDASLKAGDTVGGVFEIVVRNVPVDWVHTPNGTKTDGNRRKR